MKKNSNWWLYLVQLAYFLVMVILLSNVPVRAAPPHNVPPRHVSVAYLLLYPIKLINSPYSHSAPKHKHNRRSRPESRPVAQQ